MFFTPDNTYNDIREECLKGCISKEDKGAIKVMKMQMKELGNEAGRKTTKKPNHISARRLIWFVVVCLILFGAWLQKSIGSDSASVGSDSISESEELHVESVASEVTFRNENLLDEHY